ncbi:MAG: hypothetical protein IPM42_20040 [Saprospiraceae bacterium]|nr:hypothetical protein [Saprospiraceae bacterium]
MKQFILNFFLVLLSGTLTVVSAQKVLETGSVKMEITAVSSDDPQMAMGLEMMKGSQTEVFFDKGKHATYMNMMGGMMEIKNYVDEKENTMNMLFDMMGQKMWIEAALEDAQNAQQKEIASKSEIKYDKSDTKKVMGYNCYKMTVTNPEMEGVTLTGYVTEDIKTKANLAQGFQSLEFAGYPMEFTVGNAQFSMTMTAVDIKETVDASKFKYDTKGYKKMTMEEFQKNMGGMGGFGF